MQFFPLIKSIVEGFILKQRVRTLKKTLLLYSIRHFFEKLCNTIPRQTIELEICSHPLRTQQAS